MISKFSTFTNLILSLIGLFFAFIALFYVGTSFFDEVKNESVIYLHYWFFFTPFIYAIILMLPAYGWALFLYKKPKSKRQDFFRLISIYGYTFLSKYVPGNFLHYIGRHYLTRHYGYNHNQILSATFHEISNLISVCSFIALISIFFVDNLNLISRINSTTSNIKIILFLGVFLPVYLPRNKWIFLSFFHALFGKFKFETVIKSWTMYFFFCFLSGLLLWMLMNSNNVKIDLWQVLFVYSISYIFSYLIPGLPGGLGLREGSIIYLLNTYNGIASSVILLRIIFILGEIIFWFFCSKNLKKE